MTGDQQYSAQTAFLADIVGDVRNHAAMGHKTGNGADYEFMYAAPNNSRALLETRLVKKLGRQGMDLDSAGQEINERMCYRVRLSGHAAAHFRQLLTQRMQEQRVSTPAVAQLAPVVHFGIVRDRGRANELFANIQGDVLKGRTGSIDLAFIGVNHIDVRQTLERLLGTSDGIGVATHPHHVLGRDCLRVTLLGKAAERFLALEQVRQQSDLQT